MKIFTGKVIGTKMAKTATVEVERVVEHPVYKKRFKRIKRYHVHDELGAAVGQVVRFVASKPYSKLKKWKLLEIVGAKNEAKKPALKEGSSVKTANVTVKNTPKKKKIVKKKG